MNSLMPIVGTTAVLGSALVRGAFFAFSSFVMKALARVPSAEGVAVMQSINVVVINLSLLGAFIGTALVSVGVVLRPGKDLSQLLQAATVSMVQGAADGSGFDERNGHSWLGFRCKSTR